MGETVRLANLEPGSEAHEAQLRVVREEIREQSEAFEQLLCEEAGISREQLQVLYCQFSIGEVGKAIHRYGPGFQEHLGREDGGDDGDDGGWLHQWEVKHDR